MKIKARVIAYYLPQFHQIPENDEWWGKGFTEWTNVGRAKPLFRGHCQPRVPTDLGYYDLLNPEIREAQAKMAKNAGIEGFLYWHYWFGNGKRILEKPFNEVLSSGKPDFPFCLGWANHSWNDTSWNLHAAGKGDSRYLLEQTYPGENDYKLHFNDILPALKDKRYIKINNKPIFVIYDPLDIPNVSEFIQLWQAMAKQNNLDGIHFIGRDNSGKDHFKIRQSGFDAVNTNGQWMAECAVKGKYYRMIKKLLKQKYGRIFIDKYHYRKIIKYIFTDNDKKENYYPSILPQWDRSPRAGNKAVIYYGSTPELFEQHVKEALKLIEHKSHDNKVLFLKSWNEWGEGNYIEPDLLNGHNYLDVLKKSIY